MSTAGSAMSRFYETLQERFGESLKQFRFPPPVFVAMQGNVIDLDLQGGSLTARFPILEDWLNPYSGMQGGMIAAAADNTIGPLSVVVAPPSVTRSLEMKYSRPAVPEMGHILVQARLVERSDPQLVFEAEVTSPDGVRLASCRAVHLIVGQK